MNLFFEAHDISNFFFFTLLRSNIICISHVQIDITNERKLVARGQRKELVDSDDETLRCMKTPLPSMMPKAPKNPTETSHKPNNVTKTEDVKQGGTNSDSLNRDRHSNNSHSRRDSHRSSYFNEASHYRSRDHKRDRYGRYSSHGHDRDSRDSLDNSHRHSRNVDSRHHASESRKSSSHRHDSKRSRHRSKELDSHRSKKLKMAWGFASVGTSVKHELDATSKESSTTRNKENYSQHTISLNNVFNMNKSSQNKKISKMEELFGDDEDSGSDNDNVKRKCRKTNDMSLIKSSVKSRSSDKSEPGSDNNDIIDIQSSYFHSNSANIESEVTHNSACDKSTIKISEIVPEIISSDSTTPSSDCDMLTPPITSTMKLPVIISPASSQAKHMITRIGRPVHFSASKPQVLVDVMTSEVTLPQENNNDSSDRKMCSSDESNSPRSSTDNSNGLTISPLHIDNGFESGVSKSSCESANDSGCAGDGLVSMDLSDRKNILSSDKSSSAGVLPEEDVWSQPNIPSHSLEQEKSENGVLTSQNFTKSSSSGWLLFYRC